MPSPNLDTQHNSIAQPHHYLRPSSNKVFPPLSPNNVPTSPLKSERENTPLVNGNVENADNLSTNSFLDTSCDSTPNLTPVKKTLLNQKASGSEVKRINGVVENYSNIKLDEPINNNVKCEINEQRSSGLSTLSQVSGMSSNSTIDLDFDTSQSWC